jgi:transcriptional regulator with XRE-family HTH domain
MIPTTETERTMHHWLALTMAAARENADVRRSEVAARMRVSEGTVARFETGESWPQKGSVDQLLAAYGELLGVPDARDFWQLALDNWRQDGPLAVPRVVVSQSPADRAVDAARRASRRSAARRADEQQATGAARGGSRQMPATTRPLVAAS